MDNDGRHTDSHTEEVEDLVYGPASGEPVDEEYPWEDREVSETSGIEDIKIGAILQRAREESGVGFEEAEQATKIRKRYLEALEIDDYGSLPDPVYTLGFVRAYANFLDLDGDRLADEVRRRRARRRDQRQNNFKNLQHGRLERSTVMSGGVSGARRKLVTPATLLSAIVSVVIIAIVIGLLYYVGVGTRL